MKLNWVSSRSSRIVTTVFYAIAGVESGMGLVAFQTHNTFDVILDFVMTFSLLGINHLRLDHRAQVESMVGPLDAIIARQNDPPEAE